MIAPIARCIKRTLETSDVRVYGDAIIYGVSYKVPSGAHDKAQARGSNRLLGKIIGGFKFEISGL